MQSHLLNLDVCLDAFFQAEFLEELPMPHDTPEVVDPDRPMVVAPRFVPKAKGNDAETHIADGDLFDYDLAVEPVLQVLVGRCLDQSLAEVQAFREQVHLQLRLQAFDLERQVGLATNKRLEAEALRRAEEKYAREEQERDMKIRDRVTAHKLAARTASAGLVGQLQGEVVQRLDAHGFFYDPMVKQVEAAFMPWLLQQVQSRLENVGECRAEVDGIIQKCLVYQLADARKVMAERKHAEQEEKRLYDEKIEELEFNARLAARKEAETRAKAEEAAKAAADGSAGAD